MSRILDISEALLIFGLSERSTAEERAIALFCVTAAEGEIRRYLQYDPLLGTHTEYYPTSSHNGGPSDWVWEVSPTHAYERQIATGSTSKLILTHRPIRSITSLKIDYDGRAGTRDGSFGSDTAKTEGVDFWPSYSGLDSDGNKYSKNGILNSNGLWPLEPGSVRIVYVAGYSSAELRGEDTVIDASPIWVACLEEAQRRFLTIMSRKKHKLAGFSGPLASETLQSYSYSTNATVLNALIGGSALMFASQQKLSSFVNYGSLL